MTPSSTDARPPHPTERLAPYLPALREMLEEQREFRREQLVELGAELAAHIGHEARTHDGARFQIALSLAAGARQALSDIETALRRMDEGGYGDCASCGVAIPPERLEIIPQAGLCVSCQRDQEKC